MSPMRNKSWVYQITALCIVLGMLLAMSLKTQKQAIREGALVRFPDVSAAIRDVKQQNGKLRKELTETKFKYFDLLRRQASGSKNSRAFLDALSSSEMMACTVGLHGPGVVVTLNDSPKLDRTETDPNVIRNYLVHESDIWGVVNTLFSAGAEAISINQQRWIANSSIKCGGDIILINSVETAKPFIIKAIGKPDVLASALDMRGGASDGLFLLDMIQVKKETNVEVPAYTGASRFNVARPVEEGESKKAE